MVVTRANVGNLSDGSAYVEGPNPEHSVNRRETAGDVPANDGPADRAVGRRGEPQLRAQRVDGSGPCWTRVHVELADRSPPRRLRFIGLPYVHAVASVLSHASVLLFTTDERFIARVVAVLEAEGFAASVVGDDTDVMVMGTMSDIVILDGAVGHVETASICRRLRAASDVPVIVTSTTTDMDLIDFLAFGADDCQPSAERVRELVARIRAVLRRRPPRPGIRSDILRVGEVTLDRGRHEVVVRGAPVYLPLRQFRLLELLLANAGRVLTRTAMVRELWGRDYPGGSNTLEVQIKRLRSVVEVEPRRPCHIKTVRGVGYMYVAGG